MYKVEYGETLEYVHPDGTVQKFEQWKSFPNDGANLISYTNTRLADGAMLLQAGRHSGAYYMLGYAVECAFKTSVAKQVWDHDFPD